MALVKSKHIASYKRYTEQIIKDIGRKITLKMSKKETFCPNCNYDYSNNCSSGIYNGTGSINFTGGVCPVCNGIGKITTQEEKSIQCIIRWAGFNDGEDQYDRTSAGKIKNCDCTIKTFVANHDSIKNAIEIYVDDQKCKLLNIYKRGLKNNVVCIAGLKIDE